jgi:uncharacterized protein involved in outer membrane biogenesis
MKRFFIGLGITLAAIVAVVVFFLATTDFDDYKDEIEEALSEATGRDFHIDGEFDVQIFPPSVVAENISYANADWGSDGAMFTAGHISAKIDGSSLFNSPILITELRIENVTLVLEENEAGDQNWSIEVEDQAPVEIPTNPEDEVPVILQAADIENVSVTIRRSGSEDAVYVVDWMSVRTDAEGQMEFTGGGNIGENPVSIEGSLGPVSSFASGGDLNASIDADIGNAYLTGSVSTIDGALDIDISTTALDALGAAVAVDGLPPGPAAVKGRVLLGGNAVGLVDFNIETSLVALNTTLNAEFGDEQINLDPFSVRIDESDLTGNLSIGTTGSIDVSGNVTSKLLDLTPYTAGDEEQAAEPPPANDGYLLSEEPLPFDVLNAGNVDLEFVNGPLELEQVKANISLQDGELKLDGGVAVPGGGEASGLIALSTKADSADADVQVELVDFRLRRKEGDERSSDEVPLIGLTTDIQTSGRSVHELAANANGKVLLTQGPGKVDNSAMGLVAGDILTELLSALNPFAKEEPYSVWECTVFGMDVVDGVATINPMLAQSEKLTIVAEGAVDFNDERLDIRFNTKPRRGVGVSANMFLTPFIQLGGRMSAPRLTLDKSGVIFSGGAAVLTGGLSFFVKGAADRASGASDRCAAALAIAKGEAVEAAEQQ